MFLFIFRWLSNRVENKSDKKLFHPFSRARHKTWARKTKQKWEIGFAFRLQLLEGVYFLPVPQFVSDVKDVFLRGKKLESNYSRTGFYFYRHRKKERKSSALSLLVLPTAVSSYLPNLIWKIWWSQKFDVDVNVKASAF